MEREGLGYLKRRAVDDIDAGDFLRVVRAGTDEEEFEVAREV